MTARVILSSSALRIGKQDLLVDLHGVDHFGLIVIALKNLRARMLKHSHGQSYLGPVIDGSAQPAFFLRPANSENSKANRIETMKGPAESGQMCSVGRRKIAKKIAKNTCQHLATPFKDAV